MLWLQPYSVQHLKTPDMVKQSTHPAVTIRWLATNANTVTLWSEMKPEGVGQTENGLVLNQCVKVSSFSSGCLRVSRYFSFAHE